MSTVSGDMLEELNYIKLRCFDHFEKLRGLGEGGLGRLNWVNLNRIEWNF